MSTYTLTILEIGKNPYLSKSLEVNKERHTDFSWVTANLSWFEYKIPYGNFREDSRFWDFRRFSTGKIHLFLIFLLGTTKSNNVRPPY